MKSLLALFEPPHLDYYCLEPGLDLMESLFLLFLNLDKLLVADWTDFGEGVPRIEFLLEFFDL